MQNLALISPGYSRKHRHICKHLPLTKQRDRKRHYQEKNGQFKSCQEPEMNKREETGDLGYFQSREGLRTCLVVTYLSVCRKRREMVLGQKQKVVLGVRRATNRDSIHHGGGAAKRRLDSEGHAPAEAGKAYSQKAGPTGIQQAGLMHVWKGKQRVTGGERQARVGAARDGDKWYQKILG